MKRCLKFKAKAILDDEWVYGLPIHYNRNPRTEKWTMREDFGMETDIDIETLCQFTGISDKNGREIYEGDIICYSGVCNAFVWYGKEYCEFSLRKTLVGGGYVSVINRFDDYRYEVIGNIFDKNAKKTWEEKLKK